VNVRPFLELYERYQSEIYGIKTRCVGNITGPFLTCPGKKYWNSPLKVVFVGQETHGWCSDLSICLQMGHYRRFNLGANSARGKKYSSPFWQVIRKFEKALTGDTYNCAWLNLNRWDENRRAPSYENQQILAELDFILLEELRLLAPDLVIFFTGPSPAYDYRITSLLQAQAVPFGSLSERRLREFESSLLNARVFGTYHPNYLQRSRLADEVINAVSLAMRIYSDSSMVVNGVPVEIRQVRPTATRDSHHRLPPLAQRIDLELSHSYTASEFELIKQGFVPFDMDERWFIYYEEPWLYLHRSWTGACVYGVRFGSSANGTSIVESWANRDSEQYQEASIEADSGLCTFLIGSLLLGQDLEYPGSEGT
jgi:hypothetical protein